MLVSSLPKGAKIIKSISKDIKALSGTAIRKTDNFMTDYLLAEFATQKKNTEWRRAANSLKRHIYNKYKVDLTRSSINDGSGLARFNLLTPNHFNQLLKAVASKPNFEEIKPLLAAPGEDCTLKNRFKGMEGRVFAKTGKVSNISCLVGYVYSDKGELFSYAILSNNFYGGHSKYRQLEEDIVRLVAKL